MPELAVPIGELLAALTTPPFLIAGVARAAVARQHKISRFFIDSVVCPAYQR